MQELLFHYHRGNNFIKTYSEFRDEIKMKEKLSNRRYRWWKQAEGEASDLERRNDSAVTQMRRNETWCNNSEEKKKKKPKVFFPLVKAECLCSGADSMCETGPSPPPAVCRLSRRRGFIQTVLNMSAKACSNTRLPGRQTQRKRVRGHNSALVNR